MYALFGDMDVGSHVSHKKKETVIRIRNYIVSFILSEMTIFFKSKDYGSIQSSRKQFYDKLKVVYTRYVQNNRSEHSVQ